MKNKTNLPSGALSWLDESFNEQGILAVLRLWNAFFLAAEKTNTNVNYQFLKIKRKHMNIKTA